MISKVLLGRVRGLGCVKRDVGPKQQALGDAFSRKVKRTFCLRISWSCRSIVSLQSGFKERDWPPAGSQKAPSPVIEDVPAHGHGVGLDDL